MHRFTRVPPPSAPSLFAKRAVAKAVMAGLGVDVSILDINMC